MSCNEQLTLVRGTIQNIPVTLSLDVLSYVFTCAGVVTPPGVGDIYIQTVSAPIVTAQFVVTSVSGSVVTFQSLLESNTNDNGTTIVSATGTLTRSTGSGDVTLTYTSFTTDQYVDTAGKTIKLRILKQVVDNPQPADIIADKTATITAKGVGFFQFSVAETSTYPVGNWYGAIEIYTSATDIIEQSDQEVFAVRIDKNKV